MYLEHFGLSESPFRITPHTDFFFSGANRGATLDALLYAVINDEGIVKVSGEVGSGKTMLCRVLMERLPTQVTIVYLANPSLSRDDILYAIADELQLSLPENARPSALIRSLYDQLINLYGQGKRVVVLIDEAHAMPSETLEEVRLLSNLESNRHKLLQLVLFGQPELNGILARADMRQLKERITHNFNLEPLVRDDVAEYLEFRMRAAGYRGPNVFSPPATRLIADASEGLTRRVNILADKALLSAFSDSTHQITVKQVRAAIRDSEFSSSAGKPSTGSNLSRPAMQGTLWAAGGLLAGILATAYWMGGFNSTVREDKTEAPAKTQVTPTTANTETAIPPSPPATPVPPSPADVLQATVKSDTDSGEAQNDSHSGAQSTSPYPLLERSLRSGSAWMEKADENHWFIQLLAADPDEQRRVESFLKRIQEAQLEESDIRIYLSDLSGKLRYGVIYGDYTSATQAKEKIRSLPSWIQAQHPFPRPVRQLR